MQGPLADGVGWLRAVARKLGHGVLALALAALSLWQLRTSPHPLTATLALVTTLPLAVAGRWPVAALGVTALAAVLASALGISATPFEFVAILVALYSVSLRHERRWSALAAILVGLGTLFVRRGVDVFEVGFELALVALTWILADALRTHRALVRALEERSRSLERARSEEARRAAAEERARIARELHDVVAHSLSVIVLQAAGGRRVAAESPEEARTALAAVERAGREAMQDMRRLLGVLGEEGSQDRRPQPGLRRVDDLLEQVRAAGVDLEARVAGLPELPPALDLCAYRVLQEGLTNCMKHAPGGKVRLDIRADGGDLWLEVADDGARRRDGSWRRARGGA